MTTRPAITEIEASNSLARVIVENSSDSVAGVSEPFDYFARCDKCWNCRCAFRAKEPIWRGRVLVRGVGSLDCHWTLATGIQSPSKAPSKGRSYE